MTRIVSKQPFERASIEKPNRYQERRQRTKRAIIAAASNVFLKKGVANTTVADITEAADVGYGTFYHHFHSLNDVISSVAETTMSRVVSIASAILPEQYTDELAPAICARVFMRHLSKDQTIRWLLQQPYVFVDEWHKAITPFISGERGRIGSHAGFEAMGGLETLIRMSPWIFISELNDAINNNSSAVLEENLANMFTLLLGIDDVRRAEILEVSRRIVDKVTLPSVPRAKTSKIPVRLKTVRPKT